MSLNVLSARLLRERPRCIPLSRPRKGAKVYGLRYEKSAADAVAALYPRALHGQWIEYTTQTDAQRIRYAQPDIVIPFPDRLIVLECKLTETEEGRQQINMLYVPLLNHISGKPVYGIVVARHLTRETQRERVVSTLDLAMMACQRMVPTLHWRGKGRI